ncbi:DUF2442 domain-containing protein [Membranihabitans maritimus]|uniref:DUF2442 domain-containing protein n=1 Tax=Membranihabitans maritimus TaxID=2904244 RepID=UPI001F1F6CE5|nr:DUF2442 domain-containing protein [Membranihabitans maritimus]
MEIIEQYNFENHSECYHIIEAKYIGDFVMRLLFNDGHKSLVDFKGFLEQASHPEIKKYFDEEIFSQFRLKYGNLDWNDYELCFSLEDLYNNAISTIPVHKS